MSKSFEQVFAVYFKSKFKIEILKVVAMNFNVIFMYCLPTPSKARTGCFNKQKLARDFNEII